MKIRDSITDIFSQTIGAPEKVISYYLDNNNGIFGQVVLGENQFDYYLDSESEQLRYEPSESSRQVHFDKAPSCSSGNTPCGKVCLPKGKKCGLSKHQAGVVKGIGESLKNKETQKKIGLAAAGTAAVLGVGAIGGASLLASQSKQKTGEREKEQGKEQGKEQEKEQVKKKRIRDLWTVRKTKEKVRQIEEAYEALKKKEAEEEKLNKRKDSLGENMNTSRTTNSDLAFAIANTFDAPVDCILSVQKDSANNLEGTLLSGGYFYTFNSDSHGIEVEHKPEIDQELNDYALGLLDIKGIKTDSENTYAWARGYLRLDKQVVCKKGGTPCGKICLPQGDVCRKGMNPENKKALAAGGAGVGVGALAGAAVGGAVAIGLGAKAHEALMNKSKKPSNEASFYESMGGDKEAERMAKNNPLITKEIAKKYLNEAGEIMNAKDPNAAIAKLNKKYEKYFPSPEQKGVEKAKEEVKQATTKIGSTLTRRPSSKPKEPINMEALRKRKAAAGRKAKAIVEEVVEAGESAASSLTDEVKTFKPRAKKTWVGKKTK